MISLFPTGSTTKETSRVDADAVDRFFFKYKQFKKKGRVSFVFLVVPFAWKKKLKQNRTRNESSSKTSPFRSVERLIFEYHKWFFFLGGGEVFAEEEIWEKMEKNASFSFLLLLLLRVSLFLSFDDQSGAFSSVIIGHPEVSHRGHFRYRVFFCFYRLLLSQFSLMFTSFTEFPQAERGFT